MRNLYKKNDGFSLVELIVVVAIIAILTGALAPALIKYVKKARESAYIETADNIQLAVETMLVDAGKDGYTVVGISYNGSTDGSAGTGEIYCETESGISDISDSSVKQEYFDSMINVASIEKYTLSSSNGTPMQIALDENSAIVESNTSVGISETYILLSDSNNKKEVKLVYTSSDGWVISEQY